MLEEPNLAEHAPTSGELKDVWDRSTGLQTGHDPLPTQWIDINKGDDGNPGVTNFGQTNFGQHQLWPNQVWPAPTLAKRMTNFGQTNFGQNKNWIFFMSGTAQHSNTNTPKISGFTRQPESPNVHISGHWRFKHHQNSTIKPLREGRKNENRGGRGKKERNFGRSGGGRSGGGRSLGPGVLERAVLERAVLERGVVGRTLAKHGNWLKTLKHEFWSIWPKMVGFGQTWPKLVWPKLVLAKVGLAKLGCDQRWFGQTWIWPKLVWPNLVLAKVGLAKVGHSPVIHRLSHDWLRWTSLRPRRLQMSVAAQSLSQRTMNSFASS